MNHFFRTVVHWGGAFFIPSGGLIQPFFVQPVRDVVGDLCVIQVAEQEVGVALDADFRQADEFSLAAAFVDRVDELLRHFHAFSLLDK